VYGYMLGFYPSIEKSKGWINGILREDNDKLNKKTSSLYDKLYPYKGSRMSLDDIGIKFPKNQISADCYSLSKSARKEMDEYYRMIVANKTTDNTNINKSNENSEITTILRSRQKIELLKIPILIDLIDKYIESNKYIVVFINYLETLDKLSELLTNNDIQHSKLHGSLSEDERTVEINKFQTNSVKVILCMMQVGSQSISLHDTSGKAPRVSLIVPSFSSIDLIQALGRIYRVGLKTPVMQRIILCEDTYEKLIAEKIRDKLKFSTRLSESDNNNQMTKNLVSSLANNDLL
jgi:SNF2 family DNA or RNA helicase